MILTPWSCNGRHRRQSKESTQRQSSEKVRSHAPKSAQTPRAGAEGPAPHTRARAAPVPKGASIGYGATHSSRCRLPELGRMGQRLIQEDAQRQPQKVQAQPQGMVQWSPNPSRGRPGHRSATSMLHSAQTPAAMHAEGDESSRVERGWPRPLKAHERCSRRARPPPPPGGPGPRGPRELAVRWPGGPGGPGGRAKPREKH